MKATLSGSFGSATIDLPDNAKDDPKKLQAYIDNFETHAEDIKSGKIELPDFETFGPQSFGSSGQAGGMGDLRMAESPAGARVIATAPPPPQQQRYSSFADINPRSDYNPGKPIADVGRFAGNVGQIIPGIGNAAAQAVQDNMGPNGSPLGLARDLVYNQIKNVVNPIIPGPNLIQGTSESLQRAGIPNTPEALQNAGSMPSMGQYNPNNIPRTGKETALPGAADQLGNVIDQAVNYAPIPMVKYGSSSLAGPIAKGLGKAERLADIPNKAAGRLSSEMSQVSEEALRMRGTKEGRAALEANAGKENEIGQKLVEMMNNHETYSPNKVKIDNAINGMGKIDLSRVVKALEDSKINSPSGKLYDYEKRANAAIQRDIDALKGEDGNMLVDAQEGLSLRRRMDRTIDHNTEESSVLNTAKKKGREAFKETLIDKAKETGNPEYVSGMQDWAKQLDAKDRLEHFLGTNKETQQDRAESFVHNLWGKNKKNRQKVMTDIGEVFGSDFVNESKLANLSAQIGPEGIPAWFSRSSTGRSKLGGIPFMPFSSPKIASRVTLPITSIPPKVLGFLKNMALAKSAERQTSFANALNKMGVTDEEINKGINELVKAEIIVPESEPLKFGTPTPKSSAQFDPLEAMNPRNRTQAPQVGQGSIEDLAPPEMAQARQQAGQDAREAFIRQGREARQAQPTPPQQQPTFRTITPTEAVLKPRQPVGDIPSNFPQPYIENPKVASVLDEVQGRRGLTGETDKIKALKVELKKATTKEAKQKILAKMRDENYRTPLGDLPTEPSIPNMDKIKKLKDMLATAKTKADKQDLMRQLRAENYKIPLGNQ